MTLTDFLLARITEDETGAKYVHDYDCAQLDTFQFYGPDETEADYGCGRPARVLAECEAKRRIVATHPVELLTENPQAWRLHGHALRLLALPYADHPDYRQEWKP